MYYEEKIIDGVLMHRHIPDGGWKRCSITRMGAKIVEQADRIAVDTYARRILFWTSQNH